MQRYVKIIAITATFIINSCFSAQQTPENLDDLTRRLENLRYERLTVCDKIINHATEHGIKILQDREYRLPWSASDKPHNKAMDHAFIKTIASHEADKLLDPESALALPPEGSEVLFQTLRCNLEKFMNQYAKPDQIKRYRQIGFDFARCLEHMHMHHQKDWGKREVTVYLWDRLRNLYQPHIDKVNKQVADFEMRIGSKVPSKL